MKNLFLFVLLLIGINGYGQVLTDQHGNIIPKYDTIHCIMLCTDTTRIIRFNHYEESGDTLKLVNDTISKIPYTFWIEGYEVIQIQTPTNPDMITWTQRHIKWLDKKKQPISKKRMVWMSKEIKP